MPENLHLSREMVQQIVSETQAKREPSQPEIRRLASSLNLVLSEYEGLEKLYSEPTSQQLRAQINALVNALTRLKKKLPAPEQTSLRNYLIHLGESYASTEGQHPNLTPHSVGGVLETGEGVSSIDHYRSDQRLDEMISSVSQVLEWFNKTPAGMERLSNWWDRDPHWFEDDYELMMERLLTTPRDLPEDEHRRRHLTERLIGMQLPEVYEMTFNTRYGVSRPPGPGVRFVLAVLRHAGISKDDNQPFSSNTVIKYRQNYLRARRAAASSIAPSLDGEPKKLATPPMLDKKPKN